MTDKLDAWIQMKAQVFATYFGWGPKSEQVGEIKQALLAAETRGYQRGIEEAAKRAEISARYWIGPTFNKERDACFNVAKEIKALGGVKESK